MIFVACMQVLCTDECNCSWLHPYITLLPFQKLIWPLHLGSWFGKYEILQFGLYIYSMKKLINWCGLKQLILVLLDSSISACVAIGQVGKKGNSHAGWLPICDQVPKFCDRVTGAMIAGFAALLAYFLILLYSIHNVMNLFNLTNT